MLPLIVLPLTVSVPLTSIPPPDWSAWFPLTVASIRVSVAGESTQMPPPTPGFGSPLAERGLKIVLPSPWPCSLPPVIVTAVIVIVPE